MSGAELERATLGGMGAHDEGLVDAASSTPEEVESLYDGWAGEYDRDIAEWGYEAPRVCTSLLSELVDASTTPVLDAGCGTGLTGQALAAAGFGRVVGADLSSESVAIAARRDVYESVQQVDLSEPLPFADGEFGALLCCGVLSYVPDLASTLSEFVRVVAPGGAIVVTQRTDLWGERGTQDAIDGLAEARRCSVDVSEPAPYLPLHPEFGDTVQIRYVTLVVA